MKNPNTYTQEQRRLGGLYGQHREETFEEMLARFKADRKGHVITEGVTYSSKGESHWRVQHSTDHAEQFDVVHNGKQIAKANVRRLPSKWIRRRAKVAKSENTTYAAINSQRP